MNPWLFSLWLGACGADLASTHVAFSRGAHEANPLLTKSEGANVALVLTNCAATGVLINRLGKTHPKLAWTLAGIGMSTHGVAVTMNLRIGR